jgi:hypothetical protein
LCSSSSVLALSKNYFIAGMQSSALIVRIESVLDSSNSTHHFRRCALDRWLG